MQASFNFTVMENIELPLPILEKGFSKCSPETSMSGLLDVQSCPTLRSIPWTVAHQVSLSVEFSRQKCWSGLPVPFSREYSQTKNQTQVSCPAGGFFTMWAVDRFRGSISSQLFHNNTKRLFCYPFISHGCRVKYSRVSGCAITIEIDTRFQLSFLN